MPFLLHYCMKKPLPGAATATAGSTTGRTSAAGRTRAVCYCLSVTTAPASGAAGTFSAAATSRAMITVTIRCIFDQKASLHKSLDRIICQAFYIRTHGNAIGGKCLHGSVTDVLTDDQRYRIIIHGTCHCFMSLSKRGYHCRIHDPAIFDFIQFEEISMTKVLPYISCFLVISNCYYYYCLLYL